MCSSYGLAVDKVGKWSFGKGFVRSVVACRVENSVHQFILITILGQASTYHIDNIVSVPEKCLVLTLLKPKKKKNYLSLYCNDDNITVL